MQGRRHRPARWVASAVAAGALACSGTERTGDAATPASAETPSNALNCGTSRTLNGNGIGALTVGLGLDSLRARCQVAADTTDPRGPEGMPERRVLVRLDSVEVTTMVTNDAVHRIVVDSPALRTASGLGVGSTVAGLRPHSPQIVAGEGNVAAVIPTECGVSFLLDARQTTATPTLAALADSVRVRRVLLFGCPAGPSRR